MKRLLQTFTALIVSAVTAAAVWLLLYRPGPDFPAAESTKFIAHRGLSSQFFENSEEAFLGAAKSPFFFGIETDIWLSADGVWLCAHNNNPFKDSDKLISQITAAEAAVLPLNTDISQYKKPEGEVFICTLERYLQICKQYAKVPVIELKYVADAAQISDLKEIILNTLPLDSVMFISFHAKNISLLNAAIPNAQAMLLTNEAAVASDTVSSAAPVGLNYKKLTPALVKSAKEKGVEINVYTVNNKHTAKSFIEMGVDYITTDFIFN